MEVAPAIGFLKAYVKSMRLYYAFVTGIVGWLGISYYQFIASEDYYNPMSHFVHTIQQPTPLVKKIVIIIILFLAWGTNQIFNDYLGLDEDRVNAPERPMVTGELNAKSALLMSVSLLFITFLVTWFYLEPVAIIPLLIGIGLNVVYEYAKGHGIWGNLVFGIMISMCGLYGYWAAGPTDTYFTKSTISALILIVVTNGLMTYYTYFKDVDGDKLAGKNTIVVKYGLEKNRYIAIIVSFLPSVIFLIGYFILHAIEIELNHIFVILGLLTVFLQVWTGYLYYRNPKGELTYYSLVTNIRACTCAQTAIVALFNPELGMILFILTYVFVGFLFNMNTNVKA
ncbi:UbiA family prenyltransferase [Mangrovibacterium lignilyticum]|uniref:UbiA family prenyltransferase n=1 Tax=Mangrovibacterium lignilyticum TaxID=2668052 RepID=UPI0013D1FEAA|nr:UbiA family prenyltransferase [Mangrovibacterium lignilyticum]